MNTAAQILIPFGFLAVVVVAMLAAHRTHRWVMHPPAWLPRVWPRYRAVIVLAGSIAGVLAVAIMWAAGSPWLALVAVAVICFVSAAAMPAPWWTRLTRWSRRARREETERRVWIAWCRVRAADQASETASAWDIEGRGIDPIVWQGFRLALLDLERELRAGR